jgi:hypothetical protein
MLEVGQVFFTFNQTLALLWRHLLGNFLGIERSGSFDSNKPKNVQAI